MLKYTICFIKKGDEILLVNREKSPWMGRWNGVGGKIEKGETPEECILREVREETGITLNSVIYKGQVTWIIDGKDFGGMYAFIAELPESFQYPTPIITKEGILDWKKIAWICHEENIGVANLHYFLKTMLNDPKIYEHHFIYKGNDVIRYQPFFLNEKISSHN